MNACLTCDADFCINPSFCGECRKTDVRLQHSRPVQLIPLDWDSISINALQRRFPLIEPIARIVASSRRGAS
jgi:hypothetical protein